MPGSSPGMTILTGEAFKQPPRPRDLLAARKACEEITLATNGLDHHREIGIGLELPPQFHDETVKAAVRRLPLAIEHAGAQILARMGSALLCDKLDATNASSRRQRHKRHVRR